MQDDIEVADGAFTGTLKYLSSGQLVTDWGAGNFLAVVFSDIDSDATSVKVGLEPSVSSGLVELDADKDAVMKITDKSAQKLVAIQSNASGMYLKQEWDLSELTCETAQQDEI